MAEEGKTVIDAVPTTITDEEELNTSEQIPREDCRPLASGRLWRISFPGFDSS